jgi:hypothetical protein
MFHYVSQFTAKEHQEAQKIVEVSSPISPLEGIREHRGIAITAARTLA